MNRMSVITRSFAPDFELCVDLNRSVLECSPELSPPSHRRGSIGPQLVRSACRPPYAHPLRKGSPALHVHPRTVRQLHG